MMDALTAFHLLRPWWLLAVPLWLWLSFYVWRTAQNRDGWSALCDPALLSYLVGDSAGGQPRSKMALAALMLAGCLALFALAGPVWQQLPQPVYRAQSALVIGLDLSRSMLAADMKPNRLERAKQKLQDILALRTEGQTALVVFAGAAFDVVPLTSDNRAILAMLDALEPAMMPVQGSRASAVLEQARDIFKRNAIQHGTVLLLTDGVDAEASDVARDLVNAGHRVSVIGVGTEAGAPIPASGEAGGFIQDDSGNIVIPRLDTDSLKHLADVGHGVYQMIRFDDADIHAIAGILPSLTDAISTQQSLQTDRWREAGPWFLLLLLPLLSLAFRRGVLLSLLLLPLVLSPDDAHAMTWKDWWQTPDQQGQALIRDKKPAAAAALFQNPEWKGAALYQAGKYKQAATALAGVDSADGWYNRGNALAKAGDLKAALDAYNHALKLDKAHKDAAFNRDLVKQAMRQSQKNKSAAQNRGGQSHNKQHKQQPGKHAGKNGEQQQQSGRSGEGKKASSPQTGQQHKQQQPGQRSAANMKDQKQQAQQHKQHPGAEQQGGKHAAKAMHKAESEQDKEASAALQQWLRRIPDDPGGLLRRKFQYQYQQQNRSNGAGEQPW